MPFAGRKMKVVLKTIESNEAAPSTYPVALDAALTSLFATSAGPISVPERRLANHDSVSGTFLPNLLSKQLNARNNASANVEPSLLKSSSSITSSDSSAPEGATNATVSRSRKRKRHESEGGIEGAYLKRLAAVSEDGVGPVSVHPASTSLATAFGSSADKGSPGSVYFTEDAGVLQHESLRSSDIKATVDSDKEKRTVFLGNVSIEAMKSKSARKVLMKHLSAASESQIEGGATIKIESLRFRSVAFVSGVGPKRAAYAKRALMEETTRSTNAYVVYTVREAAEKAAQSLNGSIVLDRHLRADLAAKPAVTDYRRCIFVGNLAFVDDEAVQMVNNDGGKETRKKAKHPADAEEGLWRAFGKIGKVESVRVIRDQATRIGKGIAYVQFDDENSVEAALLLNDKKFPPLLPRKLRVTRARKPKSQPERAFRGQTRHADSTKPFPVRRTAGGTSGSTRGGTTPVRVRNESNVAFEGHRARKPSLDEAKRGKGRPGHGRKPATRSSRRGTAFRAAGGNAKQK